MLLFWHWLDHTIWVVSLMIVGVPPFEHWQRNKLGLRICCIEKNKKKRKKIIKKMSFVYFISFCLLIFEIYSFWLNWRTDIWLKNCMLTKKRHCVTMWWKLTIDQRIEFVVHRQQRQVKVISVVFVWWIGCFNHIWCSYQCHLEWRIR